MMHKRLSAIICCLALCLAGFVSSASSAPLVLRSKNAVPDAARVCNPSPADGDIILPMPGNLYMVLRAVSLPASGYLDDTRLTMGIAAPADSEAADRNLTETRYVISLSAPFEMANIPAQWGEKTVQWLKTDTLPAGRQSQDMQAYMYFIGKYEVTAGQWRAVMHPEEPFALRSGDDKPVSGISWFDSQVFLRRYSEWLMKNHPGMLPSFPKEERSSFLRLPTEVEWEYAARGGHKVPPVELERTTLHPVPQGEDMSSYIIASAYDRTLSTTSPVGMRKPNPLGLHDMLGNCAEMVQTPFQLAVDGRLIGNQGGFVIKGGSWRSADEDSLHPGRRIEASYYVGGAAQVRDDLGFRVSLGTILTPKDRKEQMTHEWEQRTAPGSTDGKPRQDVRVLIREVVREVESPELKRRLAEAEDMASRYHAQVNDKERQMQRNVIVGAAFALETMANYAARCNQQIHMLDASLALRNGVSAPQDQKKLAIIHGFTRGMQGALHYYRQLLSSLPADKTAALQQLSHVEVQFAYEDGFSHNMGRRLQILRRHLERDAGIILNGAEADGFRDILPEVVWMRIQKYMY